MTKTPIADSLRDHGSKYYNHPRYDQKLIKAIERLEIENRILRATICHLKPEWESTDWVKPA